MLKVVTNPEFTHTVPIMVPVDGGHEEQNVQARYRVRDTDELDEFDTSTAEGMKALVMAVLVSLDDLADPDGKPVTYNDKVRDHLLSLPYVRVGLVNGYYNGLLKAREGN